jgi:hypothetical protein
MKEIPEWLHENKLWLEWFEKIRQHSTEQSGKKKLVGKDLITINENQILVTLNELSIVMGSSITSAMTFIKFLTKYELITVQRIGDGRSKSNLITIL